MLQPKILVTSAAGRTGSAAVLQLLEQGFPVRAFVRRRDTRAALLEKAGPSVYRRSVRLSGFAQSVDRGFNGLTIVLPLRPICCREPCSLRSQPKKPNWKSWR